MTPQPDILFVVIDSARKDRISAYGHERETTPAFDALSSEATVYENAFTPAPWTLPSHCSMFTGRFPSEHGVTNGFIDRSFGLPSGIRTLPERLSEQGYRLGGFSNNPWVGSLSGLDRGFDTFVEWDLEVGRTSRPLTVRERLYSRFHRVLGWAASQPHVLLKRRFFTAELVERATRWLENGTTAAEPTFTFLNLMEAHSPYYPPASAFRAMGLNPPGVFEARLLNTRLLAYVMGKTDLSTEQRERVLEFYDASLRYQDRKLDELLEALRQQGTFEETLVVICADHGKTLGEYDRGGTPPHYVRDINLNVPLLVKWPGKRQHDRIADPFELSSLYDLVLHGEANPDSGTEVALGEDYIPHTGRTTTETDRWRIIADETHKYARCQTGDEYLFERGDGERLVEPSPRVLSRYRTRLDERVASLDTDNGANADSTEDGVRAGVESQLEDLGYLE